MSDEAARPKLRRQSLIRTPDQRLRVFLSSTLEELADERVAARAAIEQLRLTPVMFELGARPHPPRDLYRAYLDQSHIFVGIYGERYGWIAPGETISGLEDEYHLSGYRPKLIYIRRARTGRDPRLSELIDRIMADDVVSFREFSTADELRELIENDLAILLTERFEQVTTPEEPTHTNVPVPRSPLVGRDRELAAACELLRHGEAHLVTLTGPGGAGKSRLGLQVAVDLLGHFEDGVFLVMLEAIRDPELVVPAIAQVLGAREIPGRSELGALCDYLVGAHALLLLDNFEQVVEAAPLVSELLERCPRLSVLATSRTPLRIRGERELPTPPLDTPPVFDADVQNLSQYAAVALFVQRARGVQAGFRVTDENAPAIAEICHRLDGLPLAIELAAARLKILSPEALLARLAERFEVLTGGTRDLPERHRTLRGAIDWSHDLLGKREQRLFRRLAVFAGGATLEEVEAICCPEDDVAGEALDVIASLIDSNMLITQTVNTGDIRLGMLDTIRAYALEQLREAGEEDRFRGVHATYYCALAEEAQSHLTEADEPLWAVRLRAERDNLRLALEWCVDNDVERGLRIGSSLFRFWEAHNVVGEGYTWLTTLLARPSPPTRARGSALHSAAALGCYLGDYETARGYVTEALAIFEGLDDERRVAICLNELGVLSSYEGRFAEALDFLERSLAIKRGLGDDWLTANSMVNLGNVTEWQGDFQGAYDLHAGSLGLFEKVNDPIGVAIAMQNLGRAALHLGREEEALERLVAGLRLFDDIGDRDGCAETLETLANLATARQDFHGAARLFGLAARMREEAGTRAPRFHQAEVERGLDLTRSQLGRGTCDEELEVGRRMSIAEAFDLLGVSRGTPSAAHTRHAEAGETTETATVDRRS